ncbi:hypothetical protein L6164_008609 [Bauhinia variegata]|uniref:Uncharacterized protein n=1 Tax=Bauhinia variegata TaxID=167791 RepID=A0ACB9PGF2_BAUVA|nr:hypothetical protein L6164_008609 [Bauhinia variegata]
MVTLNGESSTILQNKLSIKKQDSRRFTIPFNIGLSLKGRVKDILVKVDKFIFPTDFVIMDMDENVDVPLLLGRPFVATSEASVDVGMGKLTLRCDDEQVTYNIFDDKKWKEGRDVKPCFMMQHQEQENKVDAVGQPLPSNTSKLVTHIETIHKDSQQSKKVELVEKESEKDPIRMEIQF